MRLFKLFDVVHPNWWMIVTENLKIAAFYSFFSALSHCKKLNIMGLYWYVLLHVTAFVSFHLKLNLMFSTCLIGFFLFLFFVLLWGGSPKRSIYLLLLRPLCHSLKYICGPAVKTFGHWWRKGPFGAILSEATALSTLSVCWRGPAEGTLKAPALPGNKSVLKTDWLKALMWKSMSGSSTTIGEAEKGSERTSLNCLLSIHGQNIMSISLQFRCF